MCSALPPRDAPSPRPVNAVGCPPHASAEAAKSASRMRRDVLTSPDLAGLNIHSVSVDELLATPWVLAVAGSVEKVPAIAATARSGLITSLVTDDRTALALLDLPAVGSHVLERRARPAARRTS